MESNNENIKDLYFTSAIDDYSFLLLANRLTITGTTNSTLVLTAASYAALFLSDDGYTFTGDTIKIGEDFTWSSNDYIYVDNNDSGSFSGLVKCYTNSNMIIKELSLSLSESD